MSQPAQPPLLRRAIVAFVIVVFCLLVLALIGWLSGGWDEAQGRGEMPDVYQGVPLDVHLLELDKVALITAYQTQLGHLFRIWLTDGAQEASRIKTGLANARRAYGEAAAQIARREAEIGGKPKP